MGSWDSGERLEDPVPFAYVGVSGAVSGLAPLSPDVRGFRTLEPPLLCCSGGC
jgi:hypothetical protein